MGVREALFPYFFWATLCGAALGLGAIWHPRVAAAVCRQIAGEGLKSGGLIRTLRQVLGWPLYLCGWGLWAHSLGMDAFFVFGVWPVWVGILIGVPFNLPYIAGIVASLLAPMVRRPGRWWITRSVSLGLTVSFLFVDAMYKAHRTGGTRFPDGGSFPIPTYPGFLWLAWGSTLVLIGVWVLPARRAIRLPGAQLEGLTEGVAR